MKEGNYAECVVPRLPRMKDGMIKGLLLLGGCVLTIGGFILHPILLFAAALAWFAIFSFWSRFNVVYEYVFVDGQIDFDKIMGGDARKNAKRIDLDNALIVAPERSHSLDSYRNNPSIKVFDFTSGSPEPGNPIFTVINQGEKGLERVLFEPDENMVLLMKKKAPRKVEEY